MNPKLFGKGLNGSEKRKIRNQVKEENIMSVKLDMRIQKGDASGTNMSLVQIKVISRGKGLKQVKLSPFNNTLGVQQSKIEEFKGKLTFKVDNKEKAITSLKLLQRKSIID